MSRRPWVLAAAFIPTLASTLPAKPPVRCDATESQFLGNWKGGNSFQEMAFEQNTDGKQFNSWLHHRPDRFGLIWTLLDCELTLINRENKAVEYRFRVKSVSRNRLVLFDIQGGLIERYRRIPQRTESF